MSKYMGFNNLTDPLVLKLDQLQKQLKGSFTITSGYRTMEEEMSLAGGVKHSQHLTGKAVDITRTGYKETPEQVEKIARSLGFTGIGFYDDHLHLDVRSGTAKWDKRTGKGKWDKDLKIVGNGGSDASEQEITFPAGLNTEEKIALTVVTLVALLGISIANK